MQCLALGMIIDHVIFECAFVQESGQVRDLNQAWDLYYHVFRRISRQLPQLTSLELQYVSPRLLSCRDLELAVPGSYVPDQDLIRIAHIQSSLQVISRCFHCLALIPLNLIFLNGCFTRIE